MLILENHKSSASSQKYGAGTVQAIVCHGECSQKSKIKSMIRFGQGISSAEVMSKFSHEFN